MLSEEEIQKYEDRLAPAITDLVFFGFDSVRIIATVHAGNETAMITQGAGSFHAQYGSVKEWIISQGEYARQDAIRVCD